MVDDVDRRGIVTGGHDPAKQELAASMRHGPTAAEALLWRRLQANRCAGLHFRRQQVIDGLIADFYCHAAGLVVEVDGPIHESQRYQDAYRDAVLAGRGLLVLRFCNHEVEQRMSHVLAAIATAARKRIQHTGVPEE